MIYDILIDFGSLVPFFPAILCHMRVFIYHLLIVNAAALRSAIGEAVRSEQQALREKQVLQKFNPVS
jgi:hypothetical protein